RPDGGFIPLADIASRARAVLPTSSGILEWRAIRLLAGALVPRLATPLAPECCDPDKPARVQRRLSRCLSRRPARGGERDRHARSDGHRSADRWGADRAAAPGGNDGGPRACHRDGEGLRPGCRWNRERTASP